MLGIFESNNIGSLKQNEKTDQDQIDCADTVEVNVPESHEYYLRDQLERANEN